MENIIIFGAKYLIAFSPLLIVLYALKANNETRKKLLIFFVISLPLTYLAGVAARELYFNPRPFVVGEFSPLIPHEADNGFPSDHILLAGALAAGMFFFSRKITVWLWIIAGVVAVSRVYAGVHHPLDVLASALIALAAAWAVNVFLRECLSDIIQNNDRQ